MQERSSLGPTPLSYTRAVAVSAGDAAETRTHCLAPRLRITFGLAIN